MMKKMWLFLFLGLVLAGGCVDKDRVTVETTDFIGWTNSWKISNRSCELILVPAINHVMSFSLTSGSNLLWVAPEVNGGMVQEAGTNWHNFGGDKVWPTSLDLWRKYTGRRWPPSYAFDGGRATAEPIPGGVRMTSKEDSDFGAVCVREFVMDPKEPLVYVRQYFKKQRGGSVDMTVWSVTQVRRPSFCLLPLGKEDDGLRYRKLGELLPGSFSTHQSVLSLKNDDAVSQKVGVMPDSSLKAGWVAACFETEGAMLLQSHELQSGVTYPDNGCDAEVFAGGGEFGRYSEIELLGPMTVMSEGRRYDHDVVWQILRMNEEEVRDPGKAGEKAAQAHRLALDRLKENALAQNKSRPEAKMGSGWKNYRLGEYSLALKDFQLAEASLPQGGAAHLAALYGEATTWYLRRPGEDLERARQLFRQVIELAPTNNLAAWSWLGLARITALPVNGEAPELEPQVAAYQDVIDRFSFHPAGEEAFLLQQAAKLAVPDEARTRAVLEALQEFIKTHPQSPWHSAAFRLVAHCGLMLGLNDLRLEATMQVWKTAEIDPANPIQDLSFTYWQLATLAEFGVGDFAMAREYYTKLIEEYPGEQKVFIAKQELKRMDELEARLRAEGATP
jgi:tetratricopeptide (TPR) repeat protein